MSRVIRKPDFCICENKDADQLRGNREADQRLCFRYTDSTIPLLSKPEISSIQPSSVVVQFGLCRTWSETPKTGFLRTRLIYELLHDKTLILLAAKFTTLIEQSVYFLNPKFQASFHLLWLYSLVCVGPAWKPKRRVFL